MYDVQCTVTCCTQVPDFPGTLTTSYESQWGGGGMGKPGRWGGGGWGGRSCGVSCIHSPRDVPPTESSKGVCNKIASAEMVSVPPCLCFERRTLIYSNIKLTSPFLFLITDNFKVFIPLQRTDR
jgi:hypothetical protein